MKKKTGILIAGAVVLVLASDRYDESEYIRKYKDFMSFKKS